MLNRIITLLMLFTLPCLLGGCSLDSLLAEKTEAPLINDRTTAIVFGGTEQDGPVWVVTDKAVINQLQHSYRWTNAHMVCCLEGTVTGYADCIEGTLLVETDMRMKLYAEDDVPAYNAAFQRELTAARENAVPMYRTTGRAASADCAADIEAALPGCIVAIGSYPRSQGLEVHILTPQPLTEAELTTLQALPGVTIP